MKTDQEPKTYCVKVVNMGDRPSATIATVALRKTAELGRDEFPGAAETNLKIVYVDDIVESVNLQEEARARALQIDRLIKPGNFAVKG